MLEDYDTLLKQQIRERLQELIEAHVALRLGQQTRHSTVRGFIPGTLDSPPPEEAFNVGETLPPAPGSTPCAKISEKLPNPDRFDAFRENLRPFP